MLKCDEIALVEEMIRQRVQRTAAPPFEFARSGNVPTSSFLNHQGVPSNVTGKQVPVNIGKLTTIYVNTEAPSTFDLVVFKYPSPFTTIAVFSIIAAAGGVYTVPTPPIVTSADQLGMRIINGSCKNIIAGYIIVGDI